MKKLEELNIDAPWQVIPYAMSTRRKPTLGDVKTSKGFILSSPLTKYRDACIIAAAPKMYKALYNALPWLEDIGREVVGNDSADKIAVVVNDIKNALAEASGDKE